MPPARGVGTRWPLWRGRAVARGRVTSGRAESCKCTDLRAGRIAPLARERSHVILVRHIIAYPLQEISSSMKSCEARDRNTATPIT